MRTRECYATEEELRCSHMYARALSRKTSTCVDAMLCSCSVVIDCRFGMRAFYGYKSGFDGVKVFGLDPAKRVCFVQTYEWKNYQSLQG